ncbi:hypothetical protein H257_12859 [Aphanomyces astaci]|uniref:Uncharacterized protein n=1 Tax=Aphanomyces astaci TaxID=112090 RepID=W4FX60_APHAT|nr:hypothetical protein H257_12859 [Aphanomyces astaci]ETV72067.1 hypothetical protein H257_12859 [Aphanomyces astaci]|eukprot:XP_009838510.1 hypothetical protein H257_12859 [Aphanomyces astaci]
MLLLPLTLFAIQGLLSTLLILATTLISLLLIPHCSFFRLHACHHREPPVSRHLLLHRATTRTCRVAAVADDVPKVRQTHEATATAMALPTERLRLCPAQRQGRFVFREFEDSDLQSSSFNVRLGIEEGCHDSGR